jgi:probable F420-dependent oxidoreductase
MSENGWADAATTRRQLGRVGVWLGALSAAPWAAARDAVRRIEALGYGALWVNESQAAKEPLAHAGLVLGVTDRIAVATGIANIWTRDATAARNGAFALAEAHPGRFTLGLGVSHQPAVDARGHEYAKPLTAMRAYLDGLDAIAWAGPQPAAPVPRLLGALRPRMLELARERAAGAHPYLTPVAHTARAREILGPDRVLAPEVSVVLETDPQRSRERARAFLGRYLAMANYANNLRDLGFGDDDLADGGSDALIDALIARGDEAAIARRLQEHLDAGADHVCLQPVGTDLAGAVAEVERLAPAVL